MSANKTVFKLLEQGPGGSTVIKFQEAFSYSCIYIDTPSTSLSRR